MTEFELWIKACEEFGTKIWCHDGSGDTAIYMTWQEGEPCPETNWVSFRKDIMCNVWIRGKRQLVCPDFRLAWEFWTRAKKEAGE